jgi:hypothetical protein
MGWWSKTIMGGDSPLDFEDNFYHICKVEKWPEGKRGMAPLPKNAIESNLNLLIDDINREEGWYQQIGYQVLAVKMLQVGCEISEGLKAKMIQTCNEDEWAQEDAEREKHCKGLARKLKAHTNVPTEVESKGLLEVFAEKIANGSK